jgi:hypothetical protein
LAHNSLVEGGGFFQFGVKLGGKLLAFSVDPQFGNTLDGFVMVDLTRTSPEILGRYMGKDEAAAFLAWHRGAHRAAS